MREAQLPFFGLLRIIAAADIGSIHCDQCYLHLI